MDVGDLLDTRRYYSRIGLWPATPAEVKPEAWLRNFKDAELEYAVALLDSFVFFNGQITDKLFTAAFHGLSREVTTSANTYAKRKRLWWEFRNQLIVTHPTGESPNATDSGYMFDRKARQLLGIDESQIMAPEHALAVLVGQPTRPLLFVDDFAGSGDQFVATWTRSYDLPDGSVTSFSNEGARAAWSPWYCPAVCTQIAADVITTSCDGVAVRAAHLLPHSYSLRSADTILLPPNLIADRESFVIEASRRAGIDSSSALGYKDLSLALAFAHSVPDATLPLFWVDSPGWTPLVRRR